MSSGIAAGALRAHALIIALSRALGGYLGSRINAKWLLVAALAVADNPWAIAIFALGEGFGFGMCLFATTLLRIDYFGTDKNPQNTWFHAFCRNIGYVRPWIGRLERGEIKGFSLKLIPHASYLYYKLNYQD